MKETQDQNKKEKKKELRKNWAFFTGIALQMTVIIGGSIWLGTFLDQKFTNSFPWFTVILSLLGVAAAITHVIVALKRFLE